MSYRVKISGQQYESQVEGAQDWTRTVIRDFNDRLFRTRGDYRFKGHRELYNLLYNHLSINGVCDPLEARIYFNTGDAWEYEWRGEVKPQDFEFDVVQRSADGQVLDASWAARFNNSEDQKVFLLSEKSNNDTFIGSCVDSLVVMFDPDTGVPDVVNPRRMFKIYDVFDYLVKYYTDAAVTFASDYFDTGDGSIYFLTTGDEIRAINASANPEVSFSEVFDEMNKMCNLWIIIEGTPDAPVLRIEPWSYIFNNTKLIEIVDPEKITISTDLDQFYSVINVGSSPTDFDPDDNASFPAASFIAWNDETYNSPTTCGFENNVLNLVNSWKIDHNSIQQQYASVGQDEGPHDNEIFLIDVQTFVAIQYTTGYTGNTTATVTYNGSQTNENKFIRWGLSLPADVKRNLNRDLFASVRTLSITSFAPTVLSGWLLLWTVEVEDDDDIYTPPSASAQGAFQPGFEGWYKFDVNIPVVNSAPGPDYQCRIAVYPSVADALLDQNGEFWLVTENPVGSPISDLIGSVGVFIPEGYVAYVTLYNPANSVVLSATATASIESIGASVELESVDPLIYIYKTGLHDMPRSDFDLIDQGLGFVRIIDTNGEKYFDVYAKEVSYNPTTGVIESGEFIGTRPPTELCWILDEGIWDDDCYWLDSKIYID